MANNISINQARKQVFKQASNATNNMANNVANNQITWLDATVVQYVNDVNDINDISLTGVYRKELRVCSALAKVADRYFTPLAAVLGAVLVAEVLLLV